MKIIKLEISPGLEATITYDIRTSSWKPSPLKYIEIKDIFVGDHIDISLVVCDRLLFDWEQEILDRLKEDKLK